MPYGLPEELDTPENQRKMEECVKSVQKDGKGEEEAIKICKTKITMEKELEKKKGKNEG